MLSARELHKTYGRGPKQTHALDGVSLKVAGGEFVVVRGPSGCGKTTLLLTLGGLLAPDAGRVDLDGKDPYALPAAQQAAFRAEAVGFVFQQFYLVPYLTVRENVLCAGLPTRGDQADVRADELIEQFHLAERRDHLPGELSTGEKQRTALARAMLNRPPVLLADEPTGNLDEQNADIVVEALKRYATDGAAVLMVTHDPRWDARADRVLQLSAGALIRTTTGSESGGQPILAADPGPQTTDN